MKKTNAIMPLDDINRKFNEDLRTLTPENANSVILNAGRPSDVLRSAGIADKTLRLYGNKVMKKARKHGFTPSDLAELPKAANNPIAVFKGSKENSHAILTELKIMNANVLVTLEAGKDRDADFNIVTSTYPKESNKILGWITDGKLLYANKEKALNYLGTPAPIAGASDNQGHNNTIKAVKDFVNP